MINYKFILKEITGTVSWQPGPDRVLETWDTANTISVTGDWEIPEFQIIDEEEVVDDVNEPCLNGSGLLIAENLNVIVGEEADEVMEERVDGNERTGDQIDNPSTHMVAENISVEDLDGSSPSSLKNESGLVVDEGLPALVPGLDTTRLEEVEAEEAEAEAEVEAEASSIIGSITATESDLEQVEAEEADLEEVEAEEAKAEASSIIGSITASESDEMVEVATVFDEIEVSTDPNQKHDSIVDETEAATKPEVITRQTHTHTHCRLPCAEMITYKLCFNGVF